MCKFNDDSVNAQQTMEFNELFSQSKVGTSVQSSKNKKRMKIQIDLIFKLIFRFSLSSSVGDTKQLSDTDVSISNCEKNRCKLRKNTKVTIEMKLQPGN